MPQPDAHRADTFLLPEVAEAYRARPPYPREVIDRLVELSNGGRVLDLGAGEGSLARRLAGRVNFVEAVERSQPMIDVGRSLPGGAAVTWNCAAAESFVVTEQFDLAVVGEAMHWFDLRVVVGRVRDALRPGAPLALVDRSTHHPALAQVVEVIRRFSRADDYDPTYDVADDLTARGLWQQLGSFTPSRRQVRQSPQDYLASLRSTSSLAAARMTEADNEAFDAAILDAVGPVTDGDGLIALDATARLVWGSV